MRRSNDLRLCDYFLHHAGRFDANEALVEALELIREPQRIEAELVKNRRVKIVDVHAVASDVEAEVVAFADRNARLDAAAGEPHCKRIRMMVAAVVAATLHHGRAAE